LRLAVERNVKPPLELRLVALRAVQLMRKLDHLDAAPARAHQPDGEDHKRPQAAHFAGAFGALLASITTRERGPTMEYAGTSCI